MKRIHTMLLVLLACCACTGVLFTGCNQDTSTTDDTGITDNENSAENVGDAENAGDDGETGDMSPAVTDEGVTTNPANQTKEDGTSDVHVTIESVSVTLDELAAQNYVIPVMITIDENAGISYTEWGVQMDERCSFEADSQGLDYSVYYAIDNDKHFMWTAWSSGAQSMTDTGSLLKLNVEIPEDAAAGDSYVIQYAPVSMAEKIHVWSNGTEDWAQTGFVTWTDGSITITE